jgi:hypothetical protein
VTLDNRELTTIEIVALLVSPFPTTHAKVIRNKRDVGNSGAKALSGKRHGAEVCRGKLPPDTFLGFNRLHLARVWCIFTFFAVKCEYAESL